MPSQRTVTTSLQCTRARTLLEFYSKSPVTHFTPGDPARVFVQDRALSPSILRMKESRLFRIRRTPAFAWGDHSGPFGVILKSIASSTVSKKRSTLSTVHSDGDASPRSRSTALLKSLRAATRTPGVFAARGTNLITSGESPASLSIVPTCKDRSAASTVP